MKRYANQFLFSLFFLFIGAVAAQNEFQSGYIINKEGRIIEGMIYNNGFYRSPDQIEFKEEGREDIKIYSVSDIQAFGIGSKVLFVAEDITIDRGKEVSSGDTFVNNERRFLRVISQSDLYRLLVYTDGGNSYYYVGKGKVPLRQLVSKYQIVENGKEKVQPYYQEVLRSLFYCEQMKSVEYTKIANNANSLSRFFKKYSECSDKSVTVEKYKSKPSGSVLQINFGLAAHHLNFMMDQTLSDRVDFDLALDPTIQFSAEGEVYAKSTWERVAFHFLLGYASFKGKSTSTNGDNDVATLKEFSELELAAGVRYYVYFSDDFRWHAGGYFNLTSMLGADVEFENRFGFEVPDYIGIGIQSGFSFKTLRCEIRYPLIRFNTEDENFTWDVTPKQDFSLRVSLRVF